MLVQCAMGAASTLRLSLLYRVLRAGELLALLAFVSWSSSHVPSAVAAATRLAGSLLLNARFVFVLGNAIVLLLYALSRRDDLSSSSSNDEQQQPAASSTTTATPSAPQHQQPAVDDSVASFPSTFTTAPATTPPLVVATPTADPPLPYSATIRSRDHHQARAEDVPTAPDPDPSLVLLRRRAAPFEDNKLQHQPSAAAARLANKARAPRRSRSEKMSSRGLGRAASPELRRCESENGARRRRSSVTARDAEACWGREDADEFRRQVEAFIARQTRFHREESMAHCEAAPAFTGALAVVE